VRARAEIWEHQRRRSCARPLLRSLTGAGARWPCSQFHTVSGEPLGSTFLQGNKARIVPAPQATLPPPATSSVPEPAQEQHQVQKRWYVFIGKPLKAWGRFASLPDPEPNQPEQKKMTKTKGRRRQRGAGAARASGFDFLWGAQSRC
jgi:hypothetical protein